MPFLKDTLGKHSGLPCTKWEQSPRALPASLGGRGPAEGPSIPRAHLHAAGAEEAVQTPQVQGAPVSGLCGGTGLTPTPARQWRAETKSESDMEGPMERRLGCYKRGLPGGTVLVAPLGRRKVLHVARVLQHLRLAQCARAAAGDSERWGYVARLSCFRESGRCTEEH